MPAETFEAHQKGKAIYFYKGQHEGKDGWIRTDKKKTPHMTYCIAVEPDGTEIPVRVKDDSIRVQRSGAMSRAEAALQIYPEVEKAVDKMCQLFAQIEFADEPDNKKHLDPNEVKHVLDKKMHDAIVRYETVEKTQKAILKNSYVDAGEPDFDMSSL